ncbi:MAG TPA: hypothetical protein DG754_04660 [Bacteroidales bacterium]|nr:hypothetical protein [Bacteroidales bacterium]
MGRINWFWFAISFHKKLIANPPTKHIHQIAEKSKETMHVCALRNIYSLRLQEPVAIPLQVGLKANDEITFTIRY